MAVEDTVMSPAMIWYQLRNTGMTDLTQPKLNEDISLVYSATNPIVPKDFSPEGRALAYGDGFFSTIGVYNTHLLWESYHQARVQSHCQALDLIITPKLEQQLWYHLKHFAASIEHGVIKVIFSRPTQSLRGYAYSEDSSANKALIWLGVMKTALLAEQTTPILTQNFEQDEPQPDQVVLQQPSIDAMCLNSQLASLPEPLAGLKSLNRLDGVICAGELQQHKQRHPELGEGLVADLEGRWVEGVMSNVFYRLKSKTGNNSTAPWYTPPINHSGVRGVMRQVMMDQLPSQGQSVQQRSLSDEDLPQLESMFFCNAVRGVIPVRQLWVGGELLELSLRVFH